MSRFLGALHSGRVLLMDGAMGTELQRAGIGEGECYEAWNLTHPDKVLAIHKAYVEAGAEVLLTNTFQAYGANLEKHQLRPKEEHIWTSGFELAWKAAGEARYVLADCGPLPKDVAGAGGILVWAWSTDISALLFETLSHDFNIGPLVRTNRIGHRPLPFLCSFTFLRDEFGTLQTREGWTPRTCAVRAKEHGLSALGANCGREIGLNDVVEIVRQYRAATDLPLFARPNAGTPTKVDGRWVYPVTPQQMADAVPAMIEAGATMIGGCCGTTPAHVAAMRKAVDEWNSCQAK